jgi:predicted kinase
MRVTILKGLPASGKSTYARELVRKNPNSIKRINKDDLRRMLDDGKWSKDAEKFIVKARDALILLALSAGKHVVVDDTNLSSVHLSNISQLVHGVAEVEEKFFDTPLKECIRRDHDRPNRVGKKVIMGMYNQFLAPKVETAPPHDPSLKDAVVCDLDGTLCNHNGRSPYAAELCEGDLVNEVVREIINNIKQPRCIVFVSGREDKFRPHTERWLKANEIEYDHLFMRATDDKRRDDIVKKEIYERELRGKFNVKFVLDDRTRVVQAWRSLGLTCLQVAPGDF